MNNKVFNSQFLFYFFLVFLIVSCAEPEDTKKSDKKVHCLPDSMVEKISTQKVELKNVYRELLLPGQINVNKDRVFRVYPTAGGIITDVHVRLGNRVEKGQILATVQSPDIAKFHKNKRAAISEKKIAERELRLAESLYESGVYSGQDLLKAQSNYEQSKSELERLKEKQMVLGVDDEQKYYAIKAPESGFVVERNINPGLRLRSNDKHVFKISDLRSVWIIANVAESDISYIRKNDEVKISTIAYPNKSFTGKIVRLSSSLDAKRRTMEAIIELSNTDFLLKPGMFANINLKAEKENSFPFINSNSLIFDNNRHYVVVYRDSCDMEIRQVFIYKRTADKVFIKSGIEENELVVCDNQILIYNELTVNREE